MGPFWLSGHLLALSLLSQSLQCLWQLPFLLPFLLFCTSTRASHEAFCVGAMC